MAQHLHELKNNYVILARSLSLLKLKSERDLEKIPELDDRAEVMEEKIKNIKTLQGRVAELQLQRQNLHFWESKRKKELDKELERVEANSRVAEHYFNSKYHVPLDDALFEVRRIRKEIRFKESDKEKKAAQMKEIIKELDAIELEYSAQRQLAERHLDIELIDRLLEQMRAPLVSTRDNLRVVQIERDLDEKTNKKIGRSR
jgi:hypothetical protein